MFDELLIPLSVPSSCFIPAPKPHRNAKDGTSEEAASEAVNESRVPRFLARRPRYCSYFPPNVFLAGCMRARISLSLLYPLSFSLSLSLLFLCLSHSI